jgi:hypothetical protein
MLIGSILLWRAMCAAALADSPNLPDPRLLSEWSSPGLSRSVRLTFTDHGASRHARLAAAIASDLHEAIHRS